jgi:hypothetical protein
MAPSGTLAEALVQEGVELALEDRVREVPARQGEVRRRPFGGDLRPLQEEAGVRTVVERT